MIENNVYTTFKIDSKGKLRIKQFYADNDQLIQKSGIVGGKIMEQDPRQCEAKNVGRANYTSAEEQAKLQAQRKYENALKVGYYATEEEARFAFKNDILTMPMLAAKWEDRKKHINKDIEAETLTSIFVQAKLDGQRALAFIEVKTSGVEVEFRSRQNRVIENMDHLKLELKDMFADYTAGVKFVLDGELYVHGENFQSNMSYVKKYYPGKTERIGFNVYDMVLEKPYVKRNETLRQIFKSRLINAKEWKVTLVPTIEIGVNNLDVDLARHHQEFIDDGYEGLMVRLNNKSCYESNKRSKSLLKYKVFDDGVGTVIDVIPSEKRPEHGRPIIEMDGITFTANTKLTHAQRVDLLSNKENYIGKSAEIRYFGWHDNDTNTGKPRFPCYYGLRNDK